MGQRYGTFAPVTFTGSGNGTLSLGTDIRTAIVTVTQHSGIGAINVSTIDANGATTMVAGGPGRYHGTSIFDRSSMGSPARQLQIVAAGSWTIEVRDLRYASVFDGTHAFGVGDNVVLTDGPAGGVTATHSGSGLFVVTLATAGGGNARIARGEGAYSGTAAVPAGPGWFVVTASGSWGLFR